MAQRNWREIWLKPEVWPLIASIGVALGVCGAQLANKISQPGMTFSKSARKGGIFHQFEDIDEVKPALNDYFKSKSNSIFEKNLAITHINRNSPPVPEIMTVESEDAEEAEEVAEEAVAEAVAEIVEEPAAEAAEEPASEVAAEIVAEVVEEPAGAKSVVVEAVIDAELLEKGAELAAELKKIEPKSAEA